MAHYRQVLSLQTLGSASLILGVLGAVFFWWVPTGMVLSIVGFLSGFIGMTLSGRSKAVSSLLVTGMVVSILALALDLVIAGFGLEVIKIHALR